MVPTQSKRSGAHRALRAGAAVRAGGPEGDRKARIIRSAQALFAQFGYHAVTIRQIAEHAQVPLALVRYYYGAKDELFHSVFERWNPVNERRLTLLAQALREASPPRLLRRVVQAFVAPVLELLDDPEGAHSAVVVMRELVHPTAQVVQAQRNYLDPLARSFLDGLRQALPQAVAEQVAWCYRYAAGVLMAYVLEARQGRVLRLAGVTPDEGCDVGREMIVDFIVAGVNAVASRTGAAPSDSLSPGSHPSRKGLR